MPKSGCKQNPIKNNKRTRKQKTNNSVVKMTINAKVQKERQETVNLLVPRERNKVLGRDAGFKKLLVSVYRDNCPDMPGFRPLYKGVTEDVVKDCVNWITQFPGVQKKTSNPDVYVRQYDIGEGRSWVDQRRAKHLFPLYIHWLEVVKNEVARIRDCGRGFPRLLQQVVVQLLTTTYHPESSQSNQTALICTQSLKEVELKSKLKEVANINYSKSNVAGFLEELREKGLAALGRTRRACRSLSIDSDGTTSESSDSDDEESSPDVNMELVAEVERLRQRVSELEAVKKQRDEFALELTKYRTFWYRRMAQQRLQAQRYQMLRAQARFQNSLPLPNFDARKGFSPPLASSFEPPPTASPELFGGSYASSGSNYGDVEMSDASSTTSQRSSASPLGSDDSYRSFLNEDRLGH